MESTLIQFIAGCLAELKPLEPLPTGAEPRLTRLPNIDAVLFDIYGTLLVSGSGDISSSDLAPEQAVNAFERAGFLSFTAKDPGNGAQVIALYREIIHRVHNRRRLEGIPFPEVDIVAIWETVVAELLKTGTVELTGPADYPKLAFLFEHLTNPVYPMPGMQAVFTAIRESRHEIGLISNAQFFSPVILNYFLTGTARASQFIYQFNNDLVVLSCRLGRAKPDPTLYTRAAEMLKHYNIVPSRTLVVGNDMRNDIHPAARAGMRTALFAGDRRSLRMREDLEGVRDCRPDVIITELSQLLKVIL